MRPTRALVAVTLTVAVALTACSQAEDAAKDAAGDAACSVARSAVDEAGRQAGNAVDEIGADPQAAEGDLRNVRDALATAEKGVSGDTKDKLADARSAVERLLGQAEDAARGAEVDTTAVQDAKGDLDRAVADVKQLC
ncbi:hypothetical protein [Nocardioides plantarum]|uniref:Uncharacterized protein n=1 Tax=Nocardioides plantarum TaxID=29299 RepID=A0ABV5KD13_9ACTN|nr:hypothetical protein [Nocardioides plantarum]